ncbi:MAG: alpha/beta fold hydrolase [Microbacteriaceae bacterium]
MTFILLHGLGGSRAQPLSLISPALPSGADVHAPDVRAHGSSTLIGSDFSLDTLAAELVPDLPAGPLTVLGISMGAALALRLALRGDLDIERLVLIRPAFTDQPLPDNLAGFPLMGQLLQSTTSLPWASAARRAEQRYSRTPEYRALLAASPLGAAGAIEQFRAPDARARARRLIDIPHNAAYSGADELASIDVPTTVVAAERDPVHPVSIAKQWAAGIPGANLTTVPARDDGLRAYVAATRAAIGAALT